MPFIEKIFNPLSSFHHKRIFMYLKKLDIDKVIDIGAHKGEFLEKMLKIEKVKSFYAFEPQKETTFSPPTRPKIITIPKILSIGQRSRLELQND